MLQVRGLRAGYGKHAEVIHGIDFDLSDGEFCCIIGANGCGKTTTLKTVLALIEPLGGTITLDGKETARMTDRERARCFAYIPQTHKLAFPFQVKDVVLMGRTPYIDRFASASKHDRRIAYAALCQLSIEHLARASYAELSGGQQQLVLIARALAQQPRVLVMDEPTASLDFGNQQLVLSRMRQLVCAGMSVLMVTHDPSHAFLCADRVVVLHEGAVLADGTPADVITPRTMRTIYGTDVRVEHITTETGEVISACIPTPMNFDGSHRCFSELIRTM